MGDLNRSAIDWLSNDNIVFKKNDQNAYIYINRVNGLRTRASFEGVGGRRPLPRKKKKRKKEKIEKKERKIEGNYKLSQITTYKMLFFSIFQ